MGTPELKATMTTIKDEQRDNALVYLEFRTDELAELPDGCRIQAVVIVRNLLDYFPTIEPNMGGSPVRVIPKSADRVESKFCPNLKASP